MYWTVNSLNLLYCECLIVVLLCCEKESLVTYGQIGSNLEQVKRVQDSLIVCTQMRANCFAWSEAHLDRYLRPPSLSANSIEPSLFIHQL